MLHSSLSLLITLKSVVIFIYLFVLFCASFVFLMTRTTPSTASGTSSMNEIATNIPETSHNMEGLMMETTSSIHEPLSRTVGTSYCQQDIKPFKKSY